MKLKTMFVVLFSLSLFAGACKKQQEAAAPDETTPTAAAQPAPEAKKADEKPAEKKAEKLALVEVTKEGNKLDPAVNPEQVPAGAWYCNMGGKVHYAAMDKGDGHCPVCHMMLSQRKD